MAACLVQLELRDLAFEPQRCAPAGGGPPGRLRPLAAIEGVEAREHDGSRVIRVGLSWGRILEPRELGLRGFRTLPPPPTGGPSRAQPVECGSISIASSKVTFMLAT